MRKILRFPPKLSQWVARILIWAAGLLTLVVLFAIILYILRFGLPQVSWTFLTGQIEDMGRSGGIFPTIVGTIALTGLAVLIAAPLGVGTAIYLTEYTREGPLSAIIRFGADCLAGVPSIIFGLFGFIFFVSTMKLGWSILSGALTLAIMILPTIIRTTEEAIRTVPNALRETSYTLGATRWQMITTVSVPCALPGIITGIILSIGRSVGETAAVIFTAGTALSLPKSLFASTRTMSVHFYILAIEGISLPMAYATGAVLLITVLLVNVLLNALVTRMIGRGRR
jgi:phosphate transport system permease protein